MDLTEKEDSTTDDDYSGLHEPLSQMQLTVFDSAHLAKAAKSLFRQQSPQTLQSESVLHAISSCAVGCVSA